MGGRGSTYRGGSAGASASELSAIAEYSMTGYSGTNYNLRNQNNTKEADLISSGLNKSEKFTGRVYRGLRFDNQSAFDNFKSTLNVGGTFQDRAFMSTSKDQNIASRFYNSDPLGMAKGRVKFIISAKGKKGSDLGGIGIKKAEGEVLFNKKAKFKITGKKVVTERDRYGDKIKVLKVTMIEI
jgi:hypothetical protein